MESASILRDYVCKFNITEEIVSPSTEWIKKIAVVVKGDDSDEEGVYEITNRSQLAQYTSKAAQIARIFDAGSTMMYIIRVKNLARISDLYKQGYYWTIILSDDWTDAEAVNGYISGFGDFDGVVARMFVLDENNQNAFLTTALTQKNFCCFATKIAENTDYSNVYYAFGNLLQLEDLDNRQYEAMPVTDGIFDLGLMNSLFDKRISFVSTDTDYGTRLSFFVINKESPIIAPYIERLLQMDIKAALVAGTNLLKPNNTPIGISEMKTYVKKKVIEEYIDPAVIPAITFELKYDITKKWIAYGTLQYTNLNAIWRYIINIIKENN